jgi:hypothetical protein
MVSSGMLHRVVLVRTTRCNIPEDTTLHIHRRENLKSYIMEFCLIIFRMTTIAQSTGTGYGLNDRGVGIEVLVEATFFFSPRRPDRFCGYHNLLSNWYRGLFPQDKATEAWRWPHLKLIPWSRIRGSLRQLPHTFSWRKK